MNRKVSEQALTRQTPGELIRRSLEGDREAFGQIVRQYQGLVSSVTFGMTGDYHKSEDLAQETFLVAWKRLAELRDLQKLPQWFCGIARMLVRNDRNRNAARPVTVSYDAEDVVEKPSRDAEPLDQVIRKERNRLVAEAITKIPERYRVPLVMSIRSGLSTPEIADTLGISEDTLYQRVSRAKKFLRTELEKQVEHSIRTTGPSEFFSLGVVAALPVMAKWTTGGTVLASAASSAAVVPEPALLVPMASVSTGTSCSTGGCSTTVFSLQGFLTSVISIVSLIFFWFFWVVGAVPGLWFSIRNAPTLRARRHLTLFSLRLHFLFGLNCCFCFCTPPLRWILSFWLFTPPYLYWDSKLRDTLFHIIDHGFYIGLLALGGLTTLVMILSPLIYRRIVREDSGLATRKRIVPLEESPLSHQRLKRSFFRYGCLLIVLYLLTVAVLAVDIDLKSLQGWQIGMGGCGLQPWEVFLRYPGTQFGIVGLLFLIAFRQSHRHFLQITKDEEIDSRFPPLVTRETPYRERLFLEWIVFFGIFLAAGLIAMVDISFIPGNSASWLTRLPFLFFTMLLLMFGGSLGVAAISVRFPAFRWFTNILGLILLVVAVTCLLKAAIYTGWRTWPFAGFFDSVKSWPIVFGVMILDLLLLIAAMAILLAGGVHLRAKWNGSHSIVERFPSRRTVLLITGAVVLPILILSLYYQSNAKTGYFVQQLIVRMHVDPSDQHSERMIALADAIENWSHSESMNQHPAIKSMHHYLAGTCHAQMLLRLGRYDEAIAGFDEILKVNYSDFSERNYTYYRGLARLLQGDYAAAIVDFDFAVREPWSHGFNSALVFYHRAVARERLGDLRGATEDYAKVIALLERYAEPPSIYSAIQRPESGKERKIGNNRLGDVGYEIPFDNLKAIRDKLLAELKE